jgi:hypothetical protein
MGREIVMYNWGKKRARGRDRIVSETVSLLQVPNTRLEEGRKRAIPVQYFVVRSKKESPRGSEEAEGEQ